MFTITDALFLLLSFVNIYFLVLFFIVFVLEGKNVRKAPAIKTLPSVSFIIPVYNKENSIAKVVESIKKLSYPKSLMEIIAVDDGSKDGSYGILKKISGIKLFRKKNGGRADALNFGIERAKGKIIACIDADSYPEKNSLIKAVRFFDDRNVAGVTVSSLANNPKNFLQKLQKLEYILLVLSRKLMERLNCIYVTPGPMALYRKDVVKKVGGFDTRNMTEDIEIAWRLLAKGYRIRMSVDSKVYTDVPGILKDWWHQRIRWNVGGTQTALKYSHLFFKKPSNIGMFILPLFTLSYLLTLFGLALFSYVFLSAAYSFIFVYLKSAFLGADLLSVQLSLNPDILSITGAFMFAVSMAWLKLSLGALKGEASIKKDLPAFAVFLLFYLAVNPFNLVASTWKFLRKSYSW